MISLNSSRVKLLIFEHYPIHYRAPLYSLLNKIKPEAIYVVYASKYFSDPEFSLTFTWDSDLLSGYSYTFVPGSSALEPPWKPWQLRGCGLLKLFLIKRPEAILLTSIHYFFDFKAYLIALFLRIPIYIRTETQEVCLSRRRHVLFVRKIFYSLIYSQIDHFFAIGALNKQHYIYHGVSNKKISMAYYSSPLSRRGYSEAVFNEKREHLRTQLSLSCDSLVVLFAAKLSKKKDPFALLHMLPFMPRVILQKLSIIFIGDGELRNELSRAAKTASESYNIPIHLAGFINQTEIPNWYIASDILVLPSARMGETWGLVVNEALTFGCSVVASEAVGCMGDFGHLPNVTTFPLGRYSELAKAIVTLSFMTDKRLTIPPNYTLESTANSVAEHAFFS